jgi:hypothetical protein
MAQNAKPLGTEGDSRLAIRLEAHEGQTQFKLGDPVMVDLVFTSPSPGYVVITDTSPYRPASDAVHIVPEDGWFRSHGSFRGQSINGNTLIDLGSIQVRVPVLLNRTITFLKPGHYEVALTTERLRPSRTFDQLTKLETCDPCRVTNSVGIEIAARDESEEVSLVAFLSHELDGSEGIPPGSEVPIEQKIALLQEIDAHQKAAASGELDQRQSEALLRKLSEMSANQNALAQKREDARREAAERLAYLSGDDAVRAKVRFIVADREKGDVDSISPIMVDGLPSSRNKQLQLDLLQAAWRDPQHVPTSVLQTALRQAKELDRGQPVTDEALLWAGTAEQRQAALMEYQREINEIADTLPQRTEQNRAETLEFLKTRGVPNQFH